MPGQYLVRLKPGAAASLIEAYFPGATIQPLRGLNLHLVTVPRTVAAIAVNAETTAAGLAADAMVQYVEPNRIRRITLAAPNDPKSDSSTQWDLFGAGGVQALQAWNLLPNVYLSSAAANPARITAASIDTGVDCTHPDFANAGGASADSVAGGQILFGGSRAFYPTAHSPAACPWQDDFGHGTHVAGTLAAATNNSVGVAALGYPLQMVVYKGLASDGTGTDSVLADAVMAAADEGVRVISASWGDAGYSQALQDAITYAWQRNTLFVASAGNSSTSDLFFPAGAVFAMAVAATDIGSLRAGFSNNGSYVRIAAPGVTIYSTLPSYANSMGGTNYGTLSGTSMAATHVAALAGLLFVQTPNASAAAVAQRIEQSATANTELQNGGWTGDYGYGIINAYNAVSNTIRPASVGGLTGQVIDQQGNLVAAQLTAVGPAPATGSTITMADPNGLYRLANLAPGNYQVTASAGTATATLSATIPPGADAILPIVLGTIYQQFTGTVTSGGSPAPGAVVQALSSGLISATTVADSTGKYTLSVTPGTYDLMASALMANPGVVTGKTPSVAGTTVNLSITQPENAAPVTVMTNPPGLNIVVDGVSYQSPHFFAWAQGSSHTLDTTATQGAASTQYVFTGWSNNVGNKSQTVTGSGAAFYTANFKTQYMLTTAASPSGGGSIAPASGFYDSGAPVSISATPANGYAFSGFSGDLSGAANPQTLTMSAPHSVTANFSSISVTVTTSPPGLSVIVDGATYTAPQSFAWNLNSTHTLDTTAIQGSGTTQSVFTGWNNTLNKSQTITVSGSTSYTATFKTQYMLTTASSPMAGGSISPAAGFYDAGAQLSVSAVPSSGYQFTGFTGDVSGPANPQTLIMSAPHTVTADFAPLIVTVTTSPPGLSIIVDGAAYTTPQSFTWTLNSSHTLDSAATQGSGSTQYVFTGWNNTPNKSQTITVNGSITYTASFKTRYLLTATASPAAGGSITPAAGFYDSGAQLSVTAIPTSGYQFTGFSGDLSGTANPQPLTMSAPRSVTANFAQPVVTVTASPAGLAIVVDGTAYTAPQSFTWPLNSIHTLDTTATQGAGSAQYVFTGWNNTANKTQSITVNGSTTYAASFKTQYLLTTASSPAAGGSITPAAGYYDSGAQLSVSAAPASGYLFTGFSGDLSGAANPQTLTMSAAHTLTANFAPIVVTVTTAPPGLGIIVDGGAYTSPQSFTWALNSTHTLDTAATQRSGSTQYVFTGWNNTSSKLQTVTVNGSTTYTASFKTQYLLSTAASPAAGGSVGPAAGFYDSGTQLTITATPAGGYSFNGFSGDLSGATNPQTLAMTAPRSATANFVGNAVGRSDALLYDPSNGQEYTVLSNAGGLLRYVPNLFSPGFDVLRTGDFNGDSQPDLVVYNSHTGLAYIGMGNGDGTYTFQSLFWSPGYDFVETGDLNGDGKTDFALYNSSTGTMYTAISDGTGGFTYKYTLVSRNYTFLRLADFNGDGKADVLLYNTTNGAAWLGGSDGAGGFAFHPLSISPGYNLADIGDLNGDGMADIILYNAVNGNAATGVSDGAGGFAFHPLLFSPEFTSVRLADFTGDGKADVTLYNAKTAIAYFGAGSGAGSFLFQSLFWSPGYDNVVPRDVNGDGKVDILLYNSSTGSEYTGISNGSGSFTYAYAYWGIGKMLAK